MNTVLKDFAGNASHLRREELDHCIAAGEVLQSTALAFDTNRPPAL